MPDDEIVRAVHQGRNGVRKALAQAKQAKSTGSSSLSPQELKCEPRGTVRVPFKKEHRCKATFSLYERADGRWFYAEHWTNAGGGGVIGSLDAATFDYPNGQKGKPRKGYPDRQACLQAAAEKLERSADGQGKKYWPAAARKVLREWKASLAPVAEQRRGIGTPLRKRVVADRDAAVRVIEAHLAEYGARAEYEQSEHLLDAINAWRGQRKPFGAAKPKKKPR